MRKIYHNVAVEETCGAVVDTKTIHRGKFVPSMFHNVEEVSIHDASEFLKSLEKYDGAVVLAERPGTGLALVNTYKLRDVGRVTRVTKPERAATLGYTKGFEKALWDAYRERHHRMEHYDGGLDETGGEAPELAWMSRDNEARVSDEELIASFPDEEMRLKLQGSNAWKYSARCPDAIYNLREEWKLAVRKSKLGKLSAKIEAGMDVDLWLETVGDEIEAFKAKKEKEIGVVIREIGHFKQVLKQHPSDEHAGELLLMARMELATLKDEVKRSDTLLEEVERLGLESMRGGFDLQNYENGMQVKDMIDKFANEFAEPHGGLDEVDERPKWDNKQRTAEQKHVAALIYDECDEDDWLA